MPGGGGFTLPTAPEISTGSVVRGVDSTGRISAVDGREHERACSEPVLTVR
ncbi:hypothetical protein SGL43_00349 [Streptomyces globisporus]|uniref:Uncharacterized protein n=1 Tax=Streptomyces globisporus TaxID=1908 RepID=A0ABN8UWV9_STRGL|nr:hypothetical protein SGL43_00349 [Streptomyces globisporus]